MEEFEKHGCFCYIFRHVFGRIKIQIYDTQGDECYVLDMPSRVYECLKILIDKFEEK